MRLRLIVGSVAAAVAVAVALASVSAGSAGEPRRASGGGSLEGQIGGSSPIQHVVVIFQENSSFDHYFGTYPHAASLPGEPVFHAAPGTPQVNTMPPVLMTANPNGANPQRLGRNDWPLCDLSHDYDPELREWDGGKMDRFVTESVDYERSDDTRSPSTYGHVAPGVTGGVTAGNCTTPLPGHTADQVTNKEVMDYYDGNTVTALWNYAQHGVLFDSAFGATFGPSTPGAINLISGQTGGVMVPPASDDNHSCTDMAWVIDLGRDCMAPKGMPTLFNGDTDVRNGTLIGDADPAFDDCASTNTVFFTGRNIGDILNQQRVTWGWFQGGFRPNVPFTPGHAAQCTQTHQVQSPNGIRGSVKKDYNPHHEPFQYYASTANPHHLPPTSVAMIGRTDQANHQYDLSDFSAALAAQNMPAVSFLKAPNYQDGHPGYSDPLDEQRFVTEMVNQIERSRFWKSTAIIIAYDDSDGFYDHVAPPILNYDTENVAGPVVDGQQWPGDQCGPPVPATGQTLDPHTGRCGLGPRLPLLVISPWAKVNAVDHTLVDTTSILRFIEDRFAGGQRIGAGSFDARAGSLATAFDVRRSHNTRLILDPSTGEPTGG
ncbi:MAG: alkaline phosphatase family protein [Actinobacteria bacterium]|nr:alkaline phosphatase family protein [Actinomycetota bacterium]